MDPYISLEALDPNHPWTARKIDNYRRASLAHGARSELVSALPAKLILQTTDRCNLKCPHCQIPSSKKRAETPWSLVERTAEVLFADLIELHPTNLGEPLTWRHFPRLCHRMERDGVLLDLTTNGTLLTPERVEWFAPIVREVKVSFDGATAGTFEHYRRGAQFSEVCDNVRGLTARLAQVRVRRPLVALQMTLMQGNYRELPGLIELAAKLRVDRVKAYHLFSFSEEMDHESLMPDLASYEVVLGEALKIGNALNIDLQLAEPPLAPSAQLIQEESVCHLPWYETWLDFDGAVLPCHSHGGQVAGYINETPFPGIWNGPLYREIRHGFGAGRPGWHCAGCGMNLTKAQEHERVPYDPQGFLHSHIEGVNRWRHPSGRRWSSRMKPFDLTDRRINGGSTPQN